MKDGADWYDSLPKGEATAWGPLYTAAVATILKDEVAVKIKPLVVKFDKQFDDVNVDMKQMKAEEFINLPSFEMRRSRAWRSYGEAMVLFSFKATSSATKADLRSSVEAIEETLAKSIGSNPFQNFPKCIVDAISKATLLKAALEK